MFEALLQDLSEEWVPFIEHPMREFGIEVRGQSSSVGSSPYSPESLVMSFSAMETGKEGGQVSESQT